MGSVWVGEQEDRPEKEISHAGNGEAVQAEGTAYAKALRLEQVWPVVGTDWRLLQPGRGEGDEVGL